MKVQTPEAGGVAESLAGHDRGRLYLIVGTEGGRVLLASRSEARLYAPWELEEPFPAPALMLSFLPAPGRRI